MSRAERIEANRQISQAMRLTSAMKGIYWTIAAVTGIVLLFALLGGGASALFLIGLGAAFATSFVGALNVEQDPRPWSLGLALALSASLVLMFVAGYGRPINIWKILFTLVVVACWPAYFAARHARRLADAHPELRMARRMRGRTIEDELGPVSTKYADQATVERSAHGRRRLAFIGGGIALLASVIYLAGRVAAPEAPPEGPTLPPPRYAVDFFVTKFRTAWNENRLDDVKAMFVPESRAKFSRGFDRIVASHAWTPLPMLPTPRIQPEGRYAAAYFEMTAEKGELYTSWAYDAPSEIWMINALRPPRD